ncbi:MAG: hypothetical protein ACYC66_15000 [Chloroflexota bacterium]
MAIKQRGTPLDAILLKVIYPFLFRSGLRKQLHRWQLWHRDVPVEAAPSPALNLVSRIQTQEAIKPQRARALSQKRVA